MTRIKAACCSLSHWRSWTDRPWQLVAAARPSPATRESRGPLPGACPHLTWTCPRPPILLERWAQFPVGRHRAAILRPPCYTLLNPILLPPQVLARLATRGPLPLMQAGQALVAQGYTVVVSSLRYYACIPPCLLPQLLHPPSFQLPCALPSGASRREGRQEAQLQAPSVERAAHVPGREAAEPGCVRCYKPFPHPRLTLTLPSPHPHLTLPS